MIKSFRGRYRFLSNFCICLIRCKGKRWSSSEALFQAVKTKDNDIREEIRKAKKPVDAQRLGRQLLLRKDWKHIKLKMMKEILRMKFTQNSSMRKRLIRTGDEELVEGNYWHDNFWGNCSCKRCKDIPGLNYLGELLMEIRKELT